MTPLAAAAGIRAALASPLWLSGDRWRTLLEPGAGADQGRPGADDAVLASRRALRLLGRIPRSPWRNTCLFRSVAECLVLRRYGVGARLRIGVGREEPGAEGIVAHAWVLRPGQRDEAADPRAGTLRVMDGSA
jgi:hypothetical protein